MPELITLGETCAVFAAKSIGRMRYSKDFELRYGGAEGTVAVGVRRLGHSAGWISQLGEDELGHAILSLICGEGVDVSNVRMVPDSQTGIFVRERLPLGEARHFYYRQDSAFSRIIPAALDEGYLASARIIHLTGITPALSASCLQTVEAVVEIARKHNILITFDPNLRLKLWRIGEAKPVLERLMACADYVLPSLEEMTLLYGEKSADAILDHLHAIGCGRVILKKGRDGAVVSLPSERAELPGYPVADPIDLMGAGDAFAAGFIAALLKGLEVKEAADLANLVGSLSVRLPGNIESLPTWGEVMQAKKGLSTAKR